jgi:hypothetical protein
MPIFIAFKNLFEIFEIGRMQIQLHFIIFAPHTVIVAQLVRAPDCGSGGRGFEPHQSPKPPFKGGFFIGFR